ncbi:carboxymuconolactone decarboxylase family protein [Undibacterium sp. Ji67W]|uniref:carboxymuconolactone decarboxylase family protein n=1 Tax=Undibacterium sp. Ji67W TaxID=3413042 RepID=UPI003BF1D3DC
MKIRHSIMLASVISITTCAYAADRLPTIAPENYSTEQKQAAQDFEANRKVPVFGPFEPLMHSPQVMTLARSMGDYLRYKSAIGNTLSELAILITARQWTQDYEWYVHQPIALKAGLKKEIVDAIADGRRPVAMSDDEDMVYDFCIELQHNKRVSEPTFKRVENRFGKKGTVDLTGIVAYYTLLAMELNVAEYQIPADGKKLERFPK